MSKPKLTWTSDALSAVTPGVREIGREDVKVAYQPIVDMGTGVTFAHEVLVRCQRESLASPLELFARAVAERATGRLGRLIRDVAFSEQPSLPLFVNIHPDELSSRWLIQPDDPIGFHDSGVYLEITETAAFSHFDLCTSVLKELCARTGAHLVIDDFGAGYSNISRILDLEPAVVKLDLALIRDIDQKPRQRAVVAHMVALCRDLGCQVVAEGIETVTELLALRDLGVQLAQGFLLARPANPPPKVNWPDEMGRVVRVAAPDRAPLSRNSTSRRAPTLPAGMPKVSIPSTPRITIEEVVRVSHSDELRPKVRPSLELRNGPAPISSANKATVKPGRTPPGIAGRVTPSVRPKSKTGPRGTASPDKRETVGPKRTPTLKGMRRSKAPPRS
jgi:EAL domain-containing protein (putative c-di-GMP-specific phosphodiesterase class I)